MMNHKSLLIGCLFAAFTGHNASAAIITADSNVESSIELGDGLSRDSPLGDNSAHGWTTGDSVDLSSNDYFAFTLVVDDGYTLNLDSFDFSALRQKHGPESLLLQYSIGGSDFQTIGSPFSSNTTSTDYSIALSGSAFQNVTDTIEFRLYGYDAKNEGGHFGITSYSFTGSVASVGDLGGLGDHAQPNPEPQSVALLGIGALLLSERLRRTQKQTVAAA